MQKKRLLPFVKRLAPQVNRLYYPFIGRQNRPVLFDLKETCPELLELDRNYEVIRNELNAILPKKDSIPRYHEVDEGQAPLSASEDKDKTWRVFHLYVMGAKPSLNRGQCPQTSALLDKIPNLFQAFFSILDAGKPIPAHGGPYFGYLRYHLGLKIPKNHPPQIRIKDQYHTWEEGKSILFDDSWNHEVYNESDDVRVVLIVDILRPMPFLPHALNWVFSFVLLRTAYGTKVVKDLMNMD